MESTRECRSGRRPGVCHGQERCRSKTDSDSSPFPGLRDKIRDRVANLAGKTGMTLWTIHIQVLAWIIMSKNHEPRGLLRTFWPYTRIMHV